MKLGFATSDWSIYKLDADGRPMYGGAGWYRVGLPVRALRAAGHDVVVGVLVNVNAVDRTTRAHVGSVLAIQEWSPGQKVDEGDTAVGQIHPDCDVLVMQRYMHGDDWLQGHGVAKGIRKARAMGQVVINDVDDWFWGVDPANRAFWSNHPKHNAGHNANHYREIVAASSLVTCSTPYLAERLRQFVSAPVHVLRNMIDVDSFSPVVQPRSKPVIGWAGAMAWRSGDVETLRGVLGSFLADNGLRFHHAGHASFTKHDGDTYPDFRMAAGIPDSVRVTTSPMVPTSEIPDLYRWFHVGVVPLAASKPFNLAKSAVKGMEMAAMGIPFVAADTPEYRGAEASGMGVVARKPVDWKRELHRLLDYDARVERAERGRKAVEAHDWKARGHEWVDLYAGLV